MFFDKYLSTQTLGNPLPEIKMAQYKVGLGQVIFFFYHLLSEPCAEQPYESQHRPTNCRLPTAEAVGEHADHWRTEEDHAHGQSPDPSCGGIKNLQSEAVEIFL